MMVMPEGSRRSRQHLVELLTLVSQHCRHQRTYLPSSTIPQQTKHFVAGKWGSFQTTILSIATDSATMQETRDPDQKQLYVERKDTKETTHKRVPDGLPPSSPCVSASVCIGPRSPE